MVEKLEAEDIRKGAMARGVDLTLERRGEDRSSEGSVRGKISP